MRRADSVKCDIDYVSKRPEDFALAEVAAPPFQTAAIGATSISNLATDDQDDQGGSYRLWNVLSMSRV